MYVTEQQIEQLKQDIVKNILEELGLCHKCSHPTWRYTSAQVIARYRLMRKDREGLMSTDRAANQLHKKYDGCSGCVDIKLAGFICLLYLLRDLNVYDTRRM